MLSQCGFQVTGIDREKSAYFQKISGARFIKGDDSTLTTLKSESFDLCISFQVLMYVKHDKEALRQLRRVLKNNGWIVLQLTNQNNYRTAITHKYLINDPYVVRYYTIEEASLKLESAGFRIERVWTEKFYAPFCTGFFNYILEILLPRQVLNLASRLTPPRHRGLINILAQKVND